MSIQNKSGGMVFAVDCTTRVMRFCILGHEGCAVKHGPASRLIVEHAAAANYMILHNRGGELIELAADVLKHNRAPQPDAALFVLALATTSKSVCVRRAAFSAAIAHCRIPTMLFFFIRATMELGTGWGRMKRAAVAMWYNSRDAKTLAYQITKYPERHGISHRNLLRMAHVRPQNAGVSVMLCYAVNGYNRDTLMARASGDLNIVDIVNYLEAASTLKHADEYQTVQLIAKHKFVREHVSCDMLCHFSVWVALLSHMPMGALIRSLGKLTSLGVIGPYSDHTATICARLADPTSMRGARVHPIKLLVAQLQYKFNMNGTATMFWRADPSVLQSLDRAFYNAFEFVPSSGKQFLLAVDVSGSMCIGTVCNAAGLTPRKAAAVMAMQGLCAEPNGNCRVMGFARKMQDLPITKSDTLEGVCRRMDEMSFGATDCAAPMLWATNHKVPVDVFVIYTDNETWAGAITAATALKQYRQVMHQRAKCIVVAFRATEFTIADPADAGMMDIAGFDSATPSIMHQFALDTL